MAKEEKEILQWHPAFYAGIQIEFEEEEISLSSKTNISLVPNPRKLMS